MGRSQTGGARDWATPSAKATEAVHKRWFKRLKVLLPTFFHLLAWRSQLYFKCYRLLTATLFHFHLPAKVIWGCVSPLFGIEQTKLFFSFSCLTPPSHTHSPPTTSLLLFDAAKFCHPFCIACEWLQARVAPFLKLHLYRGAMVTKEPTMTRKRPWTFLAYHSSFLQFRVVYKWGNAADLCVWEAGASEYLAFLLTKWSFIVNFLLMDWSSNKWKSNLLFTATISITVSP